METEALAKGRQFRDVFGTLKRKPVPWGTLSATCQVAYKPGDPNPRCQWEAIVRAPVEDVMAAIWAIDSEPMHYSKDVRYAVHGPRLPAARSVLWELISVHLWEQVGSACVFTAYGSTTRCH